MQPDSPLNKEWAMQGKSGVKAAWKALDGLLRSLPQVSPNAVQEALAGIPMPGPGFTSASGQLALLTNTGGSITGAASPMPGSRAAVLQELRQLQGGGDATLTAVMAKGVAFHHRGLMPEECHLVEAAYSSGAVSVLCCTSTMAVGVNLPARRVIFRHAFVGLQTNPIDVATYRQMSGRAGRAGIDDAGESILVACGAFSAAKLASLITSDSAPINSCLVEGKRGMKRAMLEVVVSGAVSSAGDVSRYIQCTLLAATHDFQAEVASATKTALKWLVEQKFVTWDTITSTYVPSPLGKATLASGMDPADALLVKQDLATAREAFVMATDLHLTYLVAPARLDDISIDWA
ncbi:uncharacterized protein HaLaN_14064, partial [Haematococcus lacustris]